MSILCRKTYKLRPALNKYGDGDMSNQKEKLKEWIKKYMMLPKELDTNVLDTVKEPLKDLIKLEENGKVRILVDNSSGLTAKDLITLYCIGKAFAKIADCVEDYAVSYRELLECLRLPNGTIAWALKELREENMLIPVEKGLYKINCLKIQDAVKLITGKLDIAF